MESRLPACRRNPRADRHAPVGAQDAQTKCRASRAIERDRRYLFGLPGGMFERLRVLVSWQEGAPMNEPSTRNREVSVHLRPDGFLQISHLTVNNPGVPIEIGLRNTPNP